MASRAFVYTNAILLCKNACWAMPNPHLFCIVPMQAARLFQTLYNKKDSLGLFHEGRILGYDARVCHFNMDTGCVELQLRDGRKISIDCTGVEDALDVTMAQQTELDYLIYNDPLGYADLILNGDPEEYLKNVAGSHGLED